jgi:hypothetical protein
MGADTAHLDMAGKVHPLARHRSETPGAADPDEAPHRLRVDAERPRLGELRERQHLVRVLLPQRDDLRVICGCNAARKHHLPSARLAAARPGTSGMGCAWIKVMRSPGPTSVSRAASASGPSSAGEAKTSTSGR